MVHHNQIIILASSGVLAFLLGLNTDAIAQIIPDRSLGSESSIVTPGVQTEKDAIDRIDGGAIRGSNLFHSFQDFNVGELQRVYFANPSGVENILGRITGDRTSQILGTLGVLGNANLFLINPNGIIFGSNARLDISGSFFASTSRNLILENGYNFSTENPLSPPILTVNVRPGLASWLPSQGAIANQGNLSAGQNLTLIANNLDLQGQLQAGANLTLQAADRLNVRDSITNAFIASAREELSLEANKIDIFALNHPASGFFSSQNMVFRSPNAIGGNAHFFSGGNFILDRNNGNRGDLSSSDDPVIRASGDVSFNSYTGASLHILAGGSVTIDSINITTTDSNNFINETVTLSDGLTAVAINGSLQPTVDIRAGIANANSNGITGNPTGFSQILLTNNPATSAAININRITASSGLVFLSNQYQPNTALSGDITVNSLISTANAAGGGNVAIDSRGRIITPRTLDTSGSNSTNNTFPNPGGNITLLANGDILMPSRSQIFSYGSYGGNITLQSRSAIIQAEAASGDSFIESAAYGVGKGGDVTLNSPLISLSNFVQSNLRTGASGPGGKLSITANTLQADRAQLTNITRGGNAGNVSVNANTINLNNSRIGSQTISTIGGNAGDVEINANTLVGTNGGQIFSQTEGLGNAGNIRVTALDSIDFTGTNSTGVFSGFSSIVFPRGRGNGGLIQIQTGSLSLQNGAQIRTSTRGIGNAGPINITAQKGIVIDGGLLLSLPNTATPIDIPSAIFSEVLPGARGEGNAIAITTRQLSVRNGGSISVSTASTGNAGSISIDASESVTFDGVLGEPFKPTGASLRTLEGATGRGGTLTINTPSLSITNGPQLRALTASGGDAGNIIINASEAVVISGENTGLFSNATASSTGNGGSIFIDPERVEISNGGTITVDSQGSGRGGNIEIRSDNLTLNNLARISAETASTDGGNITLNLANLLVLSQGSQISSTAGNAGAGGNGGNIKISTGFLIGFLQQNSDITANAFLGRGGNVDLTANSIFGIQFRDRLTPLNDITASSQFGVSGTVAINTPDVNPSGGLVQLSTQLSDPSDRVVVACAAAEGNSFTVAGRGGLPTDPTAPIRGQTILSDVRDFTSNNADRQVDRTITNYRRDLHQPNIGYFLLNLGNGEQNSSQNGGLRGAETNRFRFSESPISEATRWRRNTQGQIELVATLPQETLRQNDPSCSNLNK